MQNIKKSFFVLVDTFVVFFSADCESVCQFCAHWPLWSEFPRIMSPLNKKKIDPPIQFNILAAQMKNLYL